MIIIHEQNTKEIIAKHKGNHLHLIKHPCAWIFTKRLPQISRLNNTYTLSQRNGQAGCKIDRFSRYLICSQFVLFSDVKRTLLLLVHYMVLKNGKFYSRSIQLVICSHKVSLI